MPSLLETLNALLDRHHAADTLATRIGGEPSDTEAAIGPALARVIDGLATLAASNHGAYVVGGLVDQYDAPLADELDQYLVEGSAGPGNVILDRVFGAERGLVVIGLASALGQAPSLVGRLLPLLAPLVTAELSRRRDRSGLDERAVAELLAADQAEIAQAGVLEGTSFADSGLAGRSAPPRRSRRLARPPEPVNELMAEEGDVVRATGAITTIDLDRDRDVDCDSDVDTAEPDRAGSDTAGPATADPARSSQPTPPSGDSTPIDPAPPATGGGGAAGDGSDPSDETDGTDETDADVQAGPEIEIEPEIDSAPTAEPETAPVEAAESVDGTAGTAVEPESSVVADADADAGAETEPEATSETDVAVRPSAVPEHHETDTDSDTDTESDSASGTGTRGGAPEAGTPEEVAPATGPADARGTALAWLGWAVGAVVLVLLLAWLLSTCAGPPAEPTETATVIDIGGAGVSAAPAAASPAGPALGAEAAPTTEVPVAPIVPEVSGRPSITRPDLVAAVESTLAGTEVEGRVDGSTVTLIGTVADARTRDDFEARVAVLLGVESVDNQLVVVASPEAASAADAETAAGIVAEPDPVAPPAEVAPDTPAPPVGSTLNALLDLAPITFAPSSADLTDEGRAVVDQVAVHLLRNVGLIIAIDGHTDDDGAEVANLELSQRRAEAVQARLVAAGVEAGRLVAVGHGEVEPKVPNDSLDNKAINRRIEFTVR